jgi:hypothetical protein
MNDGTVLSDHVAHVRGTVENPRPREEIVRKCRDLVEPILGKAKVTKLVDSVLGIEQIRDIRALRSVLREA